MADSTTYSAVLKRLYTPDDVRDAMFPDSPIVGMMAKDTELEGLSLTVPVRYGANQGISGTFSDAQANAGSSAFKAFELTVSEKYATAKWSRKLLKQTKSKKGAFVKALTEEMDKTLLGLRRDLAMEIFGNGGRARGQISAASVVGSTTITLANIKDINKFEVGMVINTDSTDGATVGGAVTAGQDTITAINRSLGTITLANNWNAGGANLTAAAGDYIFRDGDFPSVSSGIAGILAWIPVTAPTAGDSFFGVDRSTDPVRLAGHRMSASGYTMQEAIVTALGEFGQNGAMGIDTIAIHPVRFIELVKEQMGEIVRDLKSTTGDIGYSAVKVRGPYRDVIVVPDEMCPYSYSPFLNMSTWKLHSMGGCPEIIKDDGQEILRVYNADQFEARIGWFAQLECSNPGDNGLLAW